MKAVFQYKQSPLLSEFVIEKTVVVPDEKLEQFIHEPLEFQDFISENTERMKMDTEGVYHCILVTGKGRTDGVLIESEGSSCARYVSYLPEALTLRSPALREWNQRMFTAINYLVGTGTQRTADGSWFVSFDELNQNTEYQYRSDSVNTLVDMLLEQAEVKDAELLSQGILLEYLPVFCPNYGKEETSCQTLHSLIARELPVDTYLVHPQDVGFIPVGILKAADLASGVLDEWADILNAKVTAIHSGSYGQEIELEGIPASRLMAFDDFLAGTIQHRPVPLPEMKM